MTVDLIHRFMITNVMGTPSDIMNSFFIADEISMTGLATENTGARLNTVMALHVTLEIK